MDSTNLTHHFLIAMPGLSDPDFYHTVTYICSHNEEGAMGIVINRPLNLVLGKFLEQMDITFGDEVAKDTPIYDGGPVQPGRGFVIHQYLQDWNSSLKVNEQIGVTTSLDILDAIANDRGPENTFIALGYAGWSAGQLEKEIQENIWLSSPAELHVIFDTPVKQRWNSAANLLGIDMDQLSPDAGHA